MALPRKDRPIGPVYGHISEVDLSNFNHRLNGLWIWQPGNIRTSALNQRQLSHSTQTSGVTGDTRTAHLIKQRGELSRRLLPPGARE